MLPKRKELLRGTLAEGNRDLVVCYGKKYWRHYQAIFNEVPWADKGLFRTAKIARMRIVLATHLSGKDFNTDEQLAYFAKVAAAIRSPNPSPAR